jgi:citrate lyase beta subunit
MRARRALLYMPGDDLRKIRKGVTLGVDSICMDMEDGVAFNRKAEARATIVQALSELDFGRSERLARINPVGSGLEDDDLEAVLPSRPEGIVIPKVEESGQIHKVSRRIAAAEFQNGWPEGSIHLIVLVETALGIMNLPQIVSADPRLQALIFGAEDLAGDIGAVRTPPAWEVFYARSAVVTHAAAYDLQAIDMVFIDFKNTEGLVEEAIQGAQMGYAGKQVIHPNQVEPVQRAFTPTDEQIQQAMRIIDAYASHQQVGFGAFALDGKMIDAPVVKAAERVLARARAAGKVM